MDTPNKTGSLEYTHSNLGHTKARKLILLQSETSKLIFRLHKERVVIGSVESADARLASEGVSPIHAVIDLNYDSVKDTYTPTIFDLASVTGVFVNDKKVLTAPLKNGDTIIIGKTKLKFELQDLSAVAPSHRTSEAEGRRLYMNPDEDTKALLLAQPSAGESIFDYRPTSKTALEVIMSWHGTILDVEHFVDEKQVTLGTAKEADFAIPNSSPKFPLITRIGQEFVLNLDAQMTGVIQRKQELSLLEDLRKSVVGNHVPLAKDDFAKLSFGEIDFYLSFTAAPPRLKPQKMNADPLFMRIFFASLALMGATLLALSQINVPDTLDTEPVPERIATILYQPEKYTYEKDKSKIVNVEDEPKVAEKKPVPQPTVKLNIQPHPQNEKKPIPKEMNVADKTEQKQHTKGSKTSKNAKGASHNQSQAKEGEGARAKGAEGKRGSKNASANKTAQNKALRPSPNGGKGAGSGHSQVPDEGNLDVFKGATNKIADILGNSAAQLGKGGEKIKGFGGFDTLGNGGLALSGTGKGGGGSADTLTGGLGNKGRGGGRVGTGMGAAGTGNGIVGGQARMVIRTGGPEEAVVMGSIDADAVERALLAHKDEFRLCYEKEINAENPNLAGRVGTNFVIGSSGRVTHAGIESSTLNNANTERCIIQVLKRIDFPIPRGAGVVQVTYPFKFTPVGH
jgi:pSer/pThr/pTyr-binding forkhead associated (FHA) protein/outer membrane biosynthesis protein TonB